MALLEGPTFPEVSTGVLVFPPTFPPNSSRCCLLPNPVSGLPPRLPEKRSLDARNGGSSTPATLRLWPVPPARALAGYLEAESCSLHSRGQGCCPRCAGDAEAPGEGAPPGAPTAASAHRPAGLGIRTADPCARQKTGGERASRVGRRVFETFL